MTPESTDPRPLSRDALYTQIRETDIQGHLTDEDCLTLAEVALATITPTEPGRAVIDRERLRDIIANRIEIEYDDGDLATDVVTYRIMQDIVAAERAASGGA